LYSAIRS